MPLQPHPLADIFPMMGEAEITSLAGDIKANGLREPIILHEDMILDGRNRHAACIKAGVEPMTKKWDERGDMLAFVVSKNLHRRHLTESQRAMAATKIANLKSGAFYGNQHGRVPQICGTQLAQADAAKMLNVGLRSVQHAAVVKEKGVPELQSAVEAGMATVWNASQVARRPQEEQRKIVAKGEKEIVKAAKESRAAKGTPRGRPKGYKWDGERVQRTRIRQELLSQLREAFDLLGGMPQPSDIADIVYQFERSGRVKEQLPKILNWLEGLSHELRNRAQNIDAA